MIDNQLLQMEQDLANYNKVKDIVVQKIVEEGYMSEEEGLEFVERCQVMIYKGSWFDRWFKKNMDSRKEDGYYMKIIEMSEKESNLDDLIRRTAQGR